MPNSLPSAVTLTPTSADLIVLDDLLPSESKTKDINAKIHHLETALDHLSSVFGISHELLCDLIDEIESQGRESQSTLNTISKQITDNEVASEQRDAVITESLKKGLERIDNNVVHVESVLYEQRKRLTEYHTQLTVLETYAKELEHSMQEQGENIDQRLLALSNKLASHNMMIKGLQSLYDHQQDALFKQQKAHLDLSLDVQNLEYDLHHVENKLEIHHQATRKNFIYTGSVFSFLIIAMMTAVATIYFHPEAKPHALKSAIETVNTHIDTQLLNTAQVKEDVMNMEDKVSNLQIAQETDFLGQQALEREVENIRFLMVGPGIENVGLAKPLIELGDNAIIKTMSSDNFTVQLLTVYRYQDIVDFVNQNTKHLGDAELFYSVTEKYDLKRYSLFYGNHDSFSSAQKQLQQFPLVLSQNKPWIRQVGRIQEAIK